MNHRKSLVRGRPPECEPEIEEVQTPSSCSGEGLDEAEMEEINNESKETKSEMSSAKVREFSVEQSFFLYNITAFEFYPGQPVPLHVLSCVPYVVALSWLVCVLRRCEVYLSKLRAMFQGTPKEGAAARAPPNHSVRLS